MSRLTLLLTLLAAAGCSSTGTDTDADAGTTDAAVAGDPNVVVGAFNVRLIAPVEGTAGFTSIVGKVYDGPTPATILWETAATSGACKLLTPRVPFCATPCGGSAACVEDDTCKAYPASKSVGTVDVTGVRTSAGATSFSMSPIANNYQPPGDLTLPFPAFDEGADLTIASKGSTFASAFTITTKGVAPLVLSGSALILEKDKALAITWTPPGTTGLGPVKVKLDISHHGGAKGLVTCETDDTGSLDIAATLVTQLLNLGVAGFPTIVVTRSSTGSTVIPAGRVELVASSSVERSVTIPGLESCTATSECTEGKTCQNDLTCK